MLSESLEREKQNFFNSLYDNMSEEKKAEIDEKIAVEYAKMNNCSMQEARETVSKYA